jgi:hypothetical protein
VISFDAIESEDNICRRKENSRRPSHEKSGDLPCVKVLIYLRIVL